MHKHLPATDRRTFLKSLAVAGAALALPGIAPAQAPSAGKLKLGFDNFSIRAMGWKAPALLDYAASHKLDTLLISDLDAYESLEEASLKEVRAKATDLGIEIHAGTWSICPTSKAFRNKWGTAVEHLSLGIRVAKVLGSPVLRCVLGTGEDRKTVGGIEARIQDTVEVCKACRTKAIDAGIKIAIENHAGDMQAWELVQLVKAAGEDYVGVTYDSGNATWTLEDPLASLEILGPYTVTTGIRDSMIWEYDEGAKVQWTAVGEGLTDWPHLIERFTALCPKAPINLEIISGFARPFPYLKPSFWEPWPKARASDLAAFLAMARKGKPIDPHRSPNQEVERAYQKAELERSIEYCRGSLHLGQK